MFEGENFLWKRLKLKNEDLLKIGALWEQDKMKKFKTLKKI